MRELTTTERAVLAHVVLDPDTWWDHCQSATNIADPELALYGKVVKHYVKYLQASKDIDYKTRVERGV